MKFLIITKKIWEKKNFSKLDKKIILHKSISTRKINIIKPNIIFFIHWSKKIPKNIFNRFTCIQFHCSDLPKFRGGSPIQNQILKGVKNTKISAFKVNSKIDAGDICLKKNFVLNGSANEIYVRMEKLAIIMINTIINKKKLIFTKQSGKITYYKRRKPEDSNLRFVKKNNLKNVYDFIRMLDAKGYPEAFMKLNKFKIVFKNAEYKKKEIKGEFKIVR